MDKCPLLSLSSSSVSATREGVDCPRQSLPDKRTPGLLEGFGQLSPLPWDQGKGSKWDVKTIKKKSKCTPAVRRKGS